jgi:hypothetical protein
MGSVFYSEKTAKMKTPGQGPGALSIHMKLLIIFGTRHRFVVQPFVQGV